MMKERHLSRPVDTCQQLLFLLVPTLLVPSSMLAQEPKFVAQLNTRTSDIFVNQHIAIDDKVVIASSKNHDSSEGVAVLYDAMTGEEIRTLNPRV